MTADTAAPRFTSEQMLESAETLDCFQGSPFKTYAAMLRQAAADLASLPTRDAVMRAILSAEATLKEKP